MVGSISQWNLNDSDVKSIGKSSFSLFLHNINIYGVEGREVSEITEKIALSHYPEIDWDQEYTNANPLKGT